MTIALGQNCRRIVLKSCRKGGRGCQKSGKIADVDYGWSPTKLLSNKIEYDHLKRHIASIHENKGTFKCPTCDKSFYEKTCMY